MAIKTFTTGEVLTAADTNTYLANSGLVYVKSVTIGAGVSSVDVPTCFSATYDNYLIDISGVTSNSAGGVGYFTTLAGSTPPAAGWYGNTYYVSNAVAAGWTAANNVNSVLAEAFCLSTYGTLAAQFVVYSPFLAAATRQIFSNVDNYYWRNGTNWLNNTVSYDGFRLTSSGGGTLTGGKITVYGYRKA